MCEAFGCRWRHWRGLYRPDAPPSLPCVWWYTTGRRRGLCRRRQSGTLPYSPDSAPARSRAPESRTPNTRSVRAGHRLTPIRRPPLRDVPARSPAMPARSAKPAYALAVGVGRRRAHRPIRRDRRHDSLPGPKDLPGAPYGLAGCSPTGARGYRRTARCWVGQVPAWVSVVPMCRSLPGQCLTCPTRRPGTRSARLRLSRRRHFVSPRARRARGASVAARRRRCGRSCGVRAHRRTEGTMSVGIAADDRPALERLLR